MRVLVACEFSGIVREAFRRRGHDAWSCDLLDTEIPGQHIQGDVLEVLNDGWDLMIAHPPCTYLSYVGTRHWNDEGRAELREETFGAVGQDRRTYRGSAAGAEGRSSTVSAIEDLINKAIYENDHGLGFGMQLPESARAELANLLKSAEEMQVKLGKQQDYITLLERRDAAAQRVVELAERVCTMTLGIGGLWTEVDTGDLNGIRVACAAYRKEQGSTEGEKK